MSSLTTSRKAAPKLGLPDDFFSFAAIKGHNPWLDVLRAIAVLLVLLRHGERAIMGLSPEAISVSGASPFNTLFLNGWVGVDLFLILSGYLIGKSLIKNFSKANRINVGQFFRARALRIIPAYFAVLFLIILGVFPFYNVSSENLALRVIYHMLFLQDYLPADINVVFWSLGVEEKFYILAPLMAFILVKFKASKSAFLFLGLLFLCAPIFKMIQFLQLNTSLDYQRFFEEFRSPFHLSLEPLIIGFAISYAEIKKKYSLTTGQAKSLFLSAGFASILLLFSHNFLSQFSLWDMTGQPIALAVLFGILVLSATQMTQITVWAEPLWRFVSRLSYSLYLVHFALIPLTLVLANATSVQLFWPLYLLFSFSSALLLHFLVEKPFLILKDRKRLKSANGALKV